MNWRKIYIVGDGKKKQQASTEVTTVEPASPTQPPRRPKRGIRYFWAFGFVVIAFSGGLYIGLREDYEAEIFVPNAMAQLFGGPVHGMEVDWNKVPDLDGLPANEFHSHIFGNLPQNKTAHFQERIDCRKISMSDVDFVLKFGTIYRYWPNNKNRSGGLEPKFNMEAETIDGRDLLVSFTIPTLGSPEINLITAFERIAYDPCNE